MRSDLLSGEPISAGALAYLHARAKNRVYDFVLSKYKEKSEAEGLTQIELARRIRKSPAVVSRLLNSPGNWTVETVVELLAGIANEELIPESRSLLEPDPRNYVRPDWLSPTLVDSGTESRAVTDNSSPPLDRTRSIAQNITVNFEWRK